MPESGVKCRVTAVHISSYFTVVQTVFLFPLGSWGLFCLFRKSNASCPSVRGGSVGCGDAGGVCSFANYIAAYGET